MIIPYTQVGPDLYRPLAAVIIYGPAATCLIDGLLDPGADVTLLPAKWAARLGIDPTQLPPGSAVESATGQTVATKAASVILQLRRDETVLTWKADVAVTDDAIKQVHWGFKGFLEFFMTTFDGPNRSVTLTPGANLPAVAPPVQGDAT